jgi:hypothetical protein
LLFAALFQVDGPSQRSKTEKSQLSKTNVPTKQHTHNSSRGTSCSSSSSVAAAMIPTQKKQNYCGVNTNSNPQVDLFEVNDDGIDRHVVVDRSSPVEVASKANADVDLGNKNEEAVMSVNVTPENKVTHSVSALNTNSTQSCAERQQKPPNKPRGSSSGTMVSIINVLLGNLKDADDVKMDIEQLNGQFHVALFTFVLEDVSRLMNLGALIVAYFAARRKLANIPFNETIEVNWFSVFWQVQLDIMKSVDAANKTTIELETAAIRRKYLDLVLSRQRESDNNDTSPCTVTNNDTSPPTMTSNFLIVDSFTQMSWDRADISEEYLKSTPYKLKRVNAGATDLAENSSRKNKKAKLSDAATNAAESQQSDTDESQAEDNDEEVVATVDEDDVLTQKCDTEIKKATAVVVVFRKDVVKSVNYAIHKAMTFVSRHWKNLNNTCPMISAEDSEKFFAAPTGSITFDNVARHRAHNDNQFLHIMENTKSSAVNMSQLEEYLSLKRCYLKPPASYEEVQVMLANKKKEDQKLKFAKCQVKLKREELRIECMKKKDLAKQLKLQDRHDQNAINTANKMTIEYQKDARKKAAKHPHTPAPPVLSFFTSETDEVATAVAQRVLFVEGREMFHDISFEVAQLKHNAMTAKRLLKDVVLTAEDDMMRLTLNLPELDDFLALATFCTTCRNYPTGYEVANIVKEFNSCSIYFNNRFSFDMFIPVSDHENDAFDNNTADFSYSLSRTWEMLYARSVAKYTMTVDELNKLDQNFLNASPEGLAARNLYRENIEKLSKNIAALDGDDSLLKLKLDMQSLCLRHYKGVHPLPESMQGIEAATKYLEYNCTLFSKEKSSDENANLSDCPTGWARLLYSTATQQTYQTRHPLVLKNSFTGKELQQLVSNHPNFMVHHGEHRYSPIFSPSRIEFQTSFELLLGTILERCILAMAPHLESLSEVVNFLVSFRYITDNNNYAKNIVPAIVIPQTDVLQLTEMIQKLQLKVGLLLFIASFMRCDSIL